MITKVTVTGADDKTNQKDLIDLLKLYPFVEFGILFSIRSQGSKRFPKHEWIDKLQELVIKNKVNKRHFSGHLCGKYVSDIFNGNVEQTGNVIDKYSGLFSRWQLNTHGLKHGYTRWWIDVIAKELQRMGVEIIFQYDNVNKHIMNHTVGRNGNKGFSALFDLSHGAGVLPDTWPAPIEGLDVGYAGGLSPANVVEQIEKILPAIGKRDFWIDAETHLRSDVDDTFDLGKVEAFLKAAKPYTYFGAKSV